MVAALSISKREAEWLTYWSSTMRRPSAVLRISLIAEGHQVKGGRRHRGMAQYRHLNPDLVILDLGPAGRRWHPNPDAIREHHANPVLVLSARDSEQEKVRLLDAGANDYMSKPFGVGEMMARIRCCCASESVPPAANADTSPLWPGTAAATR